MIDLLFSDSQSVVWGAIKIGFLVLVIMYIIFAYVIVRQVKLMNETLDIGFENLMRVTSYIHFAISIMLFILAFFVL